MSATSALLAGRRAAEARMTDQCRITRPSGEVDPLTGKPLDPVVVYVGRCRISGDRPYEELPEVAGAQRVIQRHILSVPVSAGPFAPDDAVTITAAPHQPHLTLPGVEFRIAGPDERSQQTSQRMYIERG